MSLNDGRILENDELPTYLTSDIALASYLMTRGYELIGAFDTGKKGFTGRPRLDYGLTHHDKEVLKDMYADIARKADEFENLFLEVPHTDGDRVNFRVFWKNTKACHHALDEPIRKDSL